MRTRGQTAVRIAGTCVCLAAFVGTSSGAERTADESVVMVAEVKPAKKKRKRTQAHASEGFGASRRGWRLVAGPWALARRPSRSPISLAIEAARSQLGKPYRWGGTGPAGFDCSGLTQYAWSAAGVDLPHNSSAQYGATKRVPLEKLRPGDLVFSGSGGIGHVGLYIGDGKMIHSPHSGRHVEVAPLHSNVIGAGRPS